MKSGVQIRERAAPMGLATVPVQGDERLTIKRGWRIFELISLLVSPFGKRPLHVPALPPPVECRKLSVDKGNDVGFVCARACFV